jgi:hypothetical protein
MPVKFGTGLILVEEQWPTVRDAAVSRSLNLQSVLQTESSGERYWNIFAADETVVFNAIIYSGSVPGSADIDQATNDLYKDDFVENYLPLVNSAVVPRTSQGVIGSAAAKGLGGFAPDPTNNPEEPIADEIVSHYADGEGSLVTRGYVFTDEGSFREDFGGSYITSSLVGTASYVAGTSQVTGVNTLFTNTLSRDYYVKISGSNEWNRVIRVPTDTSLYVDNESLTALSGTLEYSRWIPIYTGALDGVISVDASHVILSGSSQVSGCTGIKRFADYGPMFAIFRGRQTQRLEGQKTVFGFMDDPDAPEAQAMVQFDGIDQTSLKFVTSTVSSVDDENTETSTITLPASLQTNIDLTYEINVTPDYCSLSVNDVFLTKHTTHIPGPYSEMEIVAAIKNETTASNSTKLLFDSIYFSNQNQLQIASSFTEPVPIIVREDLHTLTGKTTTNTTTSDQIILSYTVPSGKVFYLLGYCVSVEGGADANPLKIGRNDISSEPGVSGSVDSNLFRVFNIPSTMSTPLEIDFGGNPRRIAAEGDEVKVAVTPSSNVSTTWRVSLDYTLRS